LGRSGCSASPVCLQTLTVVRPLVLTLALPLERERERLQFFSQPASLITYTRTQKSNVENIKTVQNEFENLHMILLCKKGSYGVCVHGKQRSIPLPNRLQSWTLKNHMQFICNSHTTTMFADSIGSGNMLTPSKTPENNWQLMRAQPKLKKPLHAPTRNRQLTIPPMLAKRSKPMVVCTCNNPNRRGCSRTMQGIVMGAAQMLTQGFNIVPTSRIGTAPLPKGMGCPTNCKQAAMEPEKFLAPCPTEKASSRLSSKIVWKCDPTGLAAILFQNSSVRCHQKTCKGDNPNSSSNITLGVAYLTPQMCLRYLS